MVANENSNSQNLKSPLEMTRSEYIGDIKGMQKSGKYHPMITDIRFWNYKNIKDGSRLEFNFPISLIVGANGTNKTSILRALQGGVAGDSLANYWFDSKLDLIPHDENKPKYVYSYDLPLVGKKEKYAQVMYQRVFRNDRKEKDYFETVPPTGTSYISNEDFANLNKKYSEYHSDTRWKPIDKSVCYIDIREMPSAYDVNMKFAQLGFIFDKGQVKKAHTSRGYKGVIQDQKDRVRSASDKILEIFNIADVGCGKDTDIQRMFKSVNVETGIYCEAPVVLSDKEVEWIGYILGRQYTKIILLTHSYFGLPGTTARVEAIDTDGNRGGSEYSEAYAGSGEYAVIMMVHRIYSAINKSLILMDEPENSLHPESQRRLMEYILMMSRVRLHQFVISTHSAYMAEEMPKESMHHLYRGGSPGVGIKSNVSSRDAFIGIGGAPATAIEKVAIKVEDALAAAVVKRTLRLFFDEREQRKYSVTYFGSCSEAINKLIPADISENRKDSLWILDGDSNSHERDNIIQRLNQRFPAKGYEYYACRVALYYINDGDSSKKGASKSNGYDAVNEYLNALSSGDQARIYRCEKEVNSKVNGFMSIKGDAEKERKSRIKSVFDWLDKHVKYLPGEDNPESWILDQLGMGKYFGEDAKNKIAAQKEEIRKCGDLIGDEQIKSEDILCYEKSLLRKISKEKFEVLYNVINGFDI